MNFFHGFLFLHFKDGRKNIEMYPPVGCNAVADPVIFPKHIYHPQKFFLLVNYLFHWVAGQGSFC